MLYYSYHQVHGEAPENVTAFKAIMAVGLNVHSNTNNSNVGHMHAMGDNVVTCM